jgi:hypothetical protein
MPSPTTTTPRRRLLICAQVCRSASQPEVFDIGSFHAAFQQQDGGILQVARGADDLCRMLSAMCDV